MNKGLAGKQQMKVCYFVGSLKFNFYFTFIQRYKVVFWCTMMKPCSEIQFNAEKTFI